MYALYSRLLIVIILLVYVQHSYVQHLITNVHSCNTLYRTTYIFNYLYQLQLYPAGMEYFFLLPADRLGRQTAVSYLNLPPGSGDRNLIKRPAVKRF